MVTWVKVELGKATEIYRGGSPRPIQNYLTHNINGINWIKIGDVSPNAKYISATKERITPEGAAYSRAVSKGDFILSNSMSFGRPYILKIDGCIHDGWLTIQNYQKNFDTDFLYYILGSEVTIQQYISMAAGSSVQNLNKEKVSHVIVDTPSLPEQRAIATALSDMDAYIAVVEKLITKKRAIKQGAMQELLTGKRRLPGFSAEWVEMSLGSLGALLKESINPQLTPYTPYTEYSMSAYDHECSPQIVSGCSMHSNRLRIINNVLLFNKLNVRQRRIWLISICPENAVCSSEFLPYFSYNVDLLFLMQLLGTNQVTSDFEGMSTGTSNSQKRITPNNFLEYKIFLPSLKTEQTAIANILSDMDAEIVTLIAKLNKMRNIKQGMMQELLTGRIRLENEIVEKIIDA